MKQLFTLTLVLCSIVAWGQTKPDTASFSNGLSLTPTISTYNYIYQNESKYPDTLKCLFHEWSDDILLDKWTSGYIVLINGFIKAGQVSWSPYYAPMALGFFDNVFLYDDKHPIKNKVLQVIIAQ